MQPIEIISALLGIAGALLLATRHRYAGWAFVIWLISNIGWIMFGANNQHWYFIAQQVVFSITSVLGIWQWLIRPRLQARRNAAKVSPGARLSLLRAHETLCLVNYPGYRFQIIGNFTGSTYLQAIFHAPCAVTGGKPVRQTTRKWQLSAHMTSSELVQTALKCVLTSVEHETREQFRFRGQAIFGPHFNVEQLATLCKQGDQALEARA